MQCHHCPRRFFDRGEFGMHRQSHSDRQQEIQTHGTEIGDFLNACAPDGPKKVILQAATLLSNWNENAFNGLVKPAPDIQRFQDALQKFPPRPGNDGSSMQQKDVSCNDCEAVFSSQEELKRHWLTRFCPGSAIIVYVMMRDPLTYKGYRIDKRLVPLDGQPLRVPCGKCPEIFSDDDAKEAHENLHETHDLICLQCDRKCDTPYELKNHYDFHEDMEFRQSRAEQHDRTASHPQMKFYVPPSTLPLNPTGNGVRKLAKRKSQRLLDAWPLKKNGQDDGELIAIGFVVPEDLERVHAADGTIQEVDPDAIVEFPMAQFTTWLDTQDTDGKFAVSSMDEDKENLVMSGAGSASKSSLNDHKMERRDMGPRRMSLLKSVLGLRLPKRLSRSDLASSQPRKLLKKESSTRFSIMSKRIKSEDVPPRSESRTSSRTSEQQVNKMSGGLGAPPPDVHSHTRPERNPFIHMRITSDGAVVEDATGRWRILQLEQISHIYSIVSAEFSLSSVSSKIASLKSRAEMNFHGRPKAAVSTYHDVLDILHQYPPIDVDLRARAEILHRMGKGYSMLNLAGEAESCFLEALAIYRRIFGRDYAPNFAILKDIAKLCERDGYVTEAAELYERVVAGRLRVLGPFAPETLSTMEELAMIKMSLGDLDSAVQLFEEVIPAFETVRGLQNESTLNAMNHISTLYQKLGLREKSLAVSRKMMPHCRTALGLESAVTRDAVTKFLEQSDSFDFPLDVKAMLDYYRRSQSVDNLRALQSLRRAYMNVGLNREAYEIFEHLAKELSILKGADSLEAFDALSGVCVSLEYLGSLDKAIQTYGHLLQLGDNMASDNPCRIRIDYARQRVTDLIHRREVLNAERRAWDLFEDGPCVSCQANTSRLCSTCHMVRSCSVVCHDRELPKHQPSCIPSVTLRESKSVAVTPRCPSLVQKDVLNMIVPSEKGTTPEITAAHTVCLDPRNFTTFRMKLSSTVNTMLVFSAEADIRYTIIGNISESGSDPAVHPAAQPRPTPSKGTSPEPVTKLGNPKFSCTWLTPRSQESVCITPMAQSAPIYLIVAPGEQLMKGIVANRVRVRSGGGEKERFEALTVPNAELIEYSQGLVLNEYMGDAFLYIVEWV